MKHKYCLPIIKPKTNEVLEMISKNQKTYDFFEIWLDYIEDLNLDFIKYLNENYGEKLIFLFRRQKLKMPKMDVDNRTKIIELARGSDSLVDLDIFDQKKEIEYLKKKTEGINLILSYHNYKETPSDGKLKDIINLMTKRKAQIYKIATFCKTDSDALRLIDLSIMLKEMGLKSVVLGMGKKGSITRIAGAFLNDEIIFAPVSIKEKSAYGQFTKQGLVKLLKNLKVCYFIADPVEHSLSPQMHMAGYKTLGMENKFLYIHKKVTTKNLGKFINQLKQDSHFNGASISTPHKTEIMKYLDGVDKVAEKIGAVNTIVKESNGKLKGYNTDWLGILNPLKKRVSNLKAKNVAVIGAGGAARAALYALTSQGCKVVIFNRDIHKAEILSAEFNCHYDSLQNINKLEGFDIVVHATKIGLNPTDAPIIQKKFIRKNHIIFDIVYSKGSKETNLIKQARQQNAIIITGKEMLFYQGLVQFELFTNKKAPVESMRKALI